jgi:hypothetical protein
MMISERIVEVESTITAIANGCRIGEPQVRASCSKKAFAEQVFDRPVHSEEGGHEDEDD